jgi:hypothetical protein
MIKFILGFIVVFALISLALDSFAQEPALIYDANGNYKGMFIVNQGVASGYDADGNYKGLVVLPMPPSQWR